MSLEKAIEDLTAALDDNTKATKALIESGGAAPSRSSRSSNKDDDKGEAETRGRGRPRGSTKDKDGGGKAPTTQSIKKAFGEYLGIEDQDEYDKRREFVESIINELGVDKISDASDEDMQRAHKWLQLKLDGKRVSFDDDSGGGGGSRGRDRSLV